MPESLPSLDLLGEEVRRELDAYLRHTDAVETKAGVVLAAAGALTVLAGTSPWRVPALVAAVSSAFAAVGVLWPRVLPRRALRDTRDAYLRSERRFTELMLLDTGIEEVEATQRALRTKTGWLKRAGGLLALAVVLQAVGTMALVLGG